VDWILGCNPFDSSTVEGVGYNQPTLFVSCEFFPPTPQIPGAVKTGIIGDDRDEPMQYGWVATEYDMPPTSLLMWFLSELPEATEAV